MTCASSYSRNDKAYLLNFISWRLEGCDSTFSLARKDHVLSISWPASITTLDSFRAIAISPISKTSSKELEEIRLQYTISQYNDMRTTLNQSIHLNVLEIENWEFGKYRSCCHDTRSLRNGSGAKRLTWAEQWPVAEYVWLWRPSLWCQLVWAVSLISAFKSAPPTRRRSTSSACGFISRQCMCRDLPISMSGHTMSIKNRKGKYPACWVTLSIYFRDNLEALCKINSL